MSVILYTQPNCLPCKRVEKQFTEAGVKFTKTDLTKDALAADYVKRVLQAKSVPVIEVDGWDSSPVVGYQPDKVKEIIGAFGV